MKIEIDLIPPEVFPWDIIGKGRLVQPRLNHEIQPYIYRQTSIKPITIGRNVRSFMPPITYLKQ